MADTLSQRVNVLFSQYVTLEAEQYAAEGFEADKIGKTAMEVSDAIHAMRDQSGNADFIASRILLDLMLTHCWPELGRVEWKADDRWTLAILESLAGRTTGAVRREAARALATIDVEVAPETADPMLGLVREYQRLREGQNGILDDDEADRRWAEVVAPSWDALTQEPPAPTSNAGAAAAIRLVRDESNGSYNPDLIRNVLTVVADALEGVA
ncbi:hypothetical protein [Aureimonas sp. AU20]|uniref:hypothetical protein n=1 Tax=Aureimonas sp. AU20 TaxID=1349819 RepID=UPI00071F2DAD|nr:hypothetical protein [Aureimonas sp. AU20]ALN75820.1 hypothetical protein M673_24005 [Aureimonas sp. AU20]